MKNLNRLIAIVVLAGILFGSCKSDQAGSKLPELDLLQYGVPLKIHAPDETEVVVDDLGIVQDITVKGGDDFNLQIIAGTAYMSNASDVVEKQKADAIASQTFSKIVEEDEKGFIFEKKYSEDRISYDFRYVRLQGDKEFVFQTGLLGQFDLEEVKRMYEAVQ
jgi:hypothetical protein